MDRVISTEPLPPGLRFCYKKKRKIWKREKKKVKIYTLSENYLLTDASESASLLRGLSVLMQSCVFWDGCFGVVDRLMFCLFD